MHRGHEINEIIHFLHSVLHEYENTLPRDITNNINSILDSTDVSPEKLKNLLESTRNEIQQYVNSISIQTTSVISIKIITIIIAVVAVGGIGSYVALNQSHSVVSVEPTVNGKPQLDVPPQVVKEASSNSGTIVGYTVSAYDKEDGPITPSCDHQSGSKFPIGETVVTCSATDSSGNHSTRSLKITATITPN